MKTTFAVLALVILIGAYVEAGSCPAIIEDICGKSCDTPESSCSVSDKEGFLCHCSGRMEFPQRKNPSAVSDFESERAPFVMDLLKLPMGLLKKVTDKIGRLEMERATGITPTLLKYVELERGLMPFDLLKDIQEQIGELLGRSARVEGLEMERTPFIGDLMKLPMGLFKKVSDSLGGLLGRSISVGGLEMERAADSSDELVNDFELERGLLPFDLLKNIKEQIGEILGRSALVEGLEMERTPLIGDLMKLPLNLFKKVRDTLGGILGRSARVEVMDLKRAADNSDDFAEDMESERVLLPFDLLKKVHEQIGEILGRSALEMERGLIPLDLLKLPMNLFKKIQGQLSGLLG